ncbi:MAG: hypothetical protein PHE47_08550 [Oscillospiraceae bacterium]|nr:hypothetical protein [Oscillospiraceae bacterium]
MNYIRGFDPEQDIVWQTSYHCKEENKLAVVWCYTPRDWRNITFFDPNDLYDYTYHLAVYDYDGSVSAEGDTGILLQPGRTLLPNFTERNQSFPHKKDKLYIETPDGTAYEIDLITAEAKQYQD